MQTTQDTIAEPSETVIIQLSNPQGLAVLGTPSTHTLTIKDNDTAGTKTLVLEIGTPVPAAPAVDAPRDGTRRSTTLLVGDNDTPG